MQDTRPLLLAETTFPPLQRASISVLQVNLGYRCNLSCVHCHVNAGPTRTEEMGAETVAQVVAFLDRYPVQCVDLTGGAPELNPHFRELVIAARERGVEVIDRCNLTILFEPGQEDLLEFLASNGVSVTASLPCYSEGNVREQRGDGVYESSIRALQLLNAVGYGTNTQLQLDLVYNPVGPFLPPPQHGLEQDYKRELLQRHGIVFNNLLAITNMPISRFGAVLLAHDQYSDYMQLLKENFDEANLETVMCRGMLSVDWRGHLYDCDFNQMLDMPLRPVGEIASDRPHLSDLLDGDIDTSPIRVAEHCFGCAAGQGSSCGGALGAS